jgi:ERCC4-type nuclease
MQTYFTSGSNVFTIRTKPTTGNSLTMSLQDMTTQVNSTASLSGITYDSYESLLSFTTSIQNTNTAQEFRATLIDGTTEIWHGSIQVYASQSYENNSKSNYRNQIPVDNRIVSNTSTNEYVILT